MRCRSEAQNLKQAVGLLQPCHEHKTFNRLEALEWSLVGAPCCDKGTEVGLLRQMLHGTSCWGCLLAMTA